MTNLALARPDYLKKIRLWTAKVIGDDGIYATVSCQNKADAITKADDIARHYTDARVSVSTDWINITDLN